MQAVLQTHQLSRSFGGRAAVEGLDLRLEAGTIFGLLGPNGAGKTTTIRLLLGLLKPSGGHAEVLGLDVRKAARQIRAQTGVLLEHSGLYERLSAADNLAFAGRAYGLERAERQARAKLLLSTFGLWERRHEPVATWSRGMRQKLAIARALIHRPRLVFLDEPTAGLDPAAAVSLRQTLLELVASTQTTLFITTHNLAEAERMCTLIGVLRQGRLAALGRPEQIRSASGQRQQVTLHGSGFDSPDVRAAIALLPGWTLHSASAQELQLDQPPSSTLAPLITAIVSHGGQIDSVQAQQGSLESAFLALVTPQQHTEVPNDR